MHDFRIILRNLRGFVLIFGNTSSIVVAETRESIVGYQATRVRCPST